MPAIKHERTTANTKKKILKFEIFSFLSTKDAANNLTLGMVIGYY